MRCILSTAVVFAFAACAIPVSGATPAATPSIEQAPTQLPRDVRPTHYDIAIVPDAAHLRFTGKATVAIDVLQSTASITLNAIDMEFSRVRLASVHGRTIAVHPRVDVDADAQTATFVFDKAIVPGHYALAMEYSGKIGTQANGLFALDYDTSAGRRRALYTQFENSDARRFVPCWDEPAYKATFDLAATVPRTQMAVSNMPIAQRTDLGGGRMRVRFRRSPKMSSYLLFFALGDFDRATTHLGATEIGVVTRKGRSPQAAFALDSARAILREYNAYFDMPYPLPKLDNIAAPGSSQFFGAMENWGAIFTFEHDMLLDPAISTEADRQRVFDVEAHEMAHQWFGDLVTMRWWDDLWLNEGFASWMQERTTEKLHPEWNSALSSVQDRDRAMNRDAIATTHPIVQHIETVEQASQAFDAITYSKGEAVLRMLEGYVGADAWRDGVRRYIKAHAHGNTVSDDLWRAVEAAAGKPITRIAHDFTLQPGVPLIRVEQARCDGDHTMLLLRQSEFSQDHPAKTPLAWSVPVIAQVVGSSATARTLVSGGKATLAVPGCGTVVVNAGQSGYFRTLYAPPQFAAIEAGFARLAPIDQLGILDDSWALGMAGLQPASDYLDLAQATPVDADPQVWGGIAETFASLNANYGSDPQARAPFRAFAIERLAPVLARTGWIAKPGEPDPVKNLRNTLVATLGALGDADVVAEAQRRFAAQSTDPEAMPPALRKTVLGVVARHADAATWDRLHAAAIAETTPLIKDDLYTELSSTEDAVLAQRALDLALTDEPGATNSARMIATVARLHPELAFDFAVAHRDMVDAKVDSTSRSRYYPSLAGNSLDPATIDKLNAFADAHIAPTSRRATDTAIATIEYRIKVRNERLPAIDAWLKKHAG